MIYLEADDPKKMFLEYQPTKNDLERLANLANKIWAKIQALDFPDTSTYSQDALGIQQFENDLLEGKI